MQMLRKRNPPDKKLEQSTADSENQKRKEQTNEQTKLATQKQCDFFWNFKNLLLILPPFQQVITKVRYVPYMTQFSDKLSHYLSSRASDREAEGLGFDLSPRNQISLYSRLLNNT